MKRVRFRDEAGSVRVGEWTDDGIVESGRTHDPATVDLLAPTEPTKVLGVGMNYRDAGDGGERPDRPRIWSKGGPNVVSHQGATVTLPDAEEVVFEGELGVVIGEQCRDVPESEVTDVLAGFTPVDDITNLDAESDDLIFRRKTFDNAAPMGPVLADPEGVPADPRIRTWVNGELRQDSADEELIFGVAEVVSHFSGWITLEPGDVIMMGTPAGLDVLSDGDRVEVEVEGVGRLEHDVETAG